MSSKIEVPRALAETLVYLHETDQYLDIDMAKLRTLLAAPAADHPERILAMVDPVGERQPFGFWRVPKGFPLQGMFVKWNEDSAGHIESKLASETFDFSMLYTAPPELAELQATIAQQAAEIERLKGGQGEPVSVAPEGWKLVPIEATRPMLRAFIAGGCSRSSYRDMIAAAPILEPVLADRSTFAEQLEKDIDIHGNYLPGVTCELLFDLGYRKSAPPAPFEFGWDCKSNDGREHRVIGDYCVACLDKVKGLNQ